MTGARETRPPWKSQRRHAGRRKSSAARVSASFAASHSSVSADPGWLLHRMMSSLTPAIASRTGTGATVPSLVWASTHSAISASIRSKCFRKRTRPMTMSSCSDVSPLSAEETLANARPTRPRGTFDFTPAYSLASFVLAPTYRSSFSTKSARLRSRFPPRRLATSWRRSAAAVAAISAVMPKPMVARRPDVARHTRGLASFSLYESPPLSRPLAGVQPRRAYLS